ncbi:MAG: class I SAM-dependent methyltransferase [Salinivirgaceae bacterium]
MPDINQNNNAMAHEFIKLLMNPNSQQGFIISNENSNLIVDSSNSQEFKFENQIAYIFNPNFVEVEKPSSFHSQFGTGFRYHDHYIKDTEVFDYFAEPQSNATQHENRRLHEAIFKKINKKSKTILDVGCGGAWVAKEAIQKGFMVISMDISSKNPVSAIKKYPSANHFGLVADVFNLPIKDETLDVIIASEIMEHVTDPKKFVEILYSKLKPNGMLIITTPYNEKIEYHLCVHCNKPTPQGAHLHVFNEQNIGQLIPQGSAWQFEKMNNRYLTRLRTHIFLKYLPFAIWRLIDKTTSFFFPKQERLLIEITRK